jgi:hypothetical protein
MDFLKLFCKKKEENPGESFSVLQAIHEGIMFIALINMAYRGYTYKAKFPWFLSILIPLIDECENGIPNAEDAKDLNNFEDVISAKLSESCSYHFIGRITGDGCREICYYLDDPQKAVMFLNEMLDNNECRLFTYNSEKDEEWESVSAYLK